jgi:hypothetical protein
MKLRPVAAASAVALLVAGGLYVRSAAVSSARAAGGQAAASQTASQAEEIAKLKEEIEALKHRLPSQSHTMMDVDYQFTNLWFAGQAENWPLAGFYLNETINHIGWAVTTVPVRPTSHGSFDLRPMFEGIKESSFADLRKTIDGKDKAAFTDAYKTVLVDCNSCHQAAEKGYLRPGVPDEPASRIIQMKPSS